MIHLKDYIDMTEGGKGRPTHTYCELALNDELELDEGTVVLYDSREHELKDVVSDAVRELDATDRSRPLSARPIPEKYVSLAQEKGVCLECLRNCILGRCWPAEPAKMSQDERRQFVKDWLGNTIFSDRHLQRMEDLQSVFMAIAFAVPPQDYLENVGIIYEHMSKQMPRSINGYPCFFSYRAMHKEDWERIAPVLQAELDRQENLEV